MRGYFGIGVEGVSKPMNLGSLLRTAHAFAASFAFTIAAGFDPTSRSVRRSDTSDAADNLPLHAYGRVADLRLPQGCRLVGIEVLPEATLLPSFRHPRRAAYVLGAERGTLSPELVERCDFLVRIPAKFCVNLGVAGAIVMYDRMLTLGRFAERPVAAGGPAAAPPPHVHGEPLWKTKAARRGNS